MAPIGSINNYTIKTSDFLNIKVDKIDIKNKPIYETRKENAFTIFLPTRMYSYKQGITSIFKLCICTYILSKFN